MKVLITAIEGVVILEPEVFGDARGYFFESYSQRRFDAQVRPVRFVLDNESHSRRSVSAIHCPARSARDGPVRRSGAASSSRRSNPARRRKPPALE